MVVNYKDPVPLSHIDDSAKVGNRKPQMGCIGKAQRLNPQRYFVNSPGVGAYEMAAYTSLAKAKQSTYVAVSREKTRNHRSRANTGKRSASNMDTLDVGQLSNARSGTGAAPGDGHQSARVFKRNNLKAGMTSPNDLSMYGAFNTFHHSKGNQSFSGKRSQIQLGGPSTVNQDRMNLCSRDARDQVFTHEHHKNFIGRGVPGPAEYHTNRISSLNSRHASGTKSTVPKVSCVSFL